MRAASMSETRRLAVTPVTHTYPNVAHPDGDVCALARRVHVARDCVGDAGRYRRLALVADAPELARPHRMKIDGVTRVGRSRLVHGSVAGRAGDRHLRWRRYVVPRGESAGRRISHGASRPAVRRGLTWQRARRLQRRTSMR